MVKNSKGRKDDIVDDSVFAALGLGPEGDEEADQLYASQHGGSDDVVTDDVFESLGLGPEGDEEADRLYAGQHGGRLFEVIRNPETGRNVSIYGKVGQRILRNYVNIINNYQSGGAIRAGSLIPSPEPFNMDGGAGTRKTGPKSFHKKQNEEKKKVKKMVKKGKTVHPNKLKETGVRVAKTGGAIRAGSLIPSPEPFNLTSQTGGHKGPCGVNPKSGRCHKTSKWDKTNCALKNGRCVSNAAKKTVKKTAKKTVKKSVSSRKSKSTKSATKQSSDMVWVGDLGDIRENPDGQVIGWATVNGEMYGDFLQFKVNKMQKDPRKKANRKPVAFHTSESAMKIVEENLARLGKGTKTRDPRKVNIKTVGKHTPRPSTKLSETEPHRIKVKVKDVPVRAKKSAKKSSSKKTSSKECNMYKIRKDGSRRLSARCYYDTHGASSVGDMCDGAWGGKPGCLRLTGKNGSPRFLKCQSGDSHAPCKE